MAINILQPEIYNRISAGEVVEKPASVVKELIENAIDANATNINISIIGGGIEQIIVTDNGYGISEDDIKKAFLPHSTSKIKDINDLDNIYTLGFRGEALASIASVSKIQMTSKTKEQETGNCIFLNGGIIEKIESRGCPTGTQMVVNNLFYNTPARYKFLRKPKQEEGEITNLVSKFILSNPHIAFTYMADNKIIYQNSKCDLKQAIYVVYGKECYDNLLEVKFKSDNLKITGYVGKPNYVKSNRTYQTLMVNGRYVSNQTVSTAVLNAFSGYLMTGKFPFFVINITIPFENVDVNVHPSKMEVKFQDNNAIFKAVYNAVQNALETVNTVVEIKHEFKPEKFVNEQISIPQLQSREGVSFIDRFSHTEEPNKVASVNVISTISNSEILKEEKDVQSNELFGLKQTKSINFAEIENRPYDNICINNSLQVKCTFDEDYAYKLVGTLFNTYIVIEKDNQCYIIDQHAGHERLLFDNLYQQIQYQILAVQPLLIPQMISVNRVEFDFILGKLDNLKELGFDIEEFGQNTFKINAIPQLLSAINMQTFFDELLGDLNSFKTITNEEIIRDKLASKACKSAVKAGDNLNDLEIKTLICNMMKQTTPYLCPHGRPIILKITITELEKMFKRIV